MQESVYKNNILSLPKREREEKHLKISKWAVIMAAIIYIKN